MNRFKRPWLVGAGAGLLTLLFGVFLPFIQGSSPSAIYVNLVWDLFYGIGWGIGGTVFQEIFLNRIAGVVGGLIWPALLFSLVMYSGKRIAEAKWPPRVKYGLLILFLGNALPKHSTGDGYAFSCTKFCDWYGFKLLAAR